MLATTIHKSNTTPHHQSGATTRHLEPTPKDNKPAVSKPNSVSGSSPQQGPMFIAHQTPSHYSQEFLTAHTPTN